MKNNKLIAEFMGMTYGDSWYRKSMRYNVSWDWLMPVVEKIESLGYEFTIVENRCKVSNNTDHSVEELFHIETIGSKFKTTYDAVVEFIKNYKNK
jgi:hypothetical protein